MEKYLNELEAYLDYQDFQDSCILGNLGTGRAQPELVCEQACREARRLGIACEEPPLDISPQEAMNFIAELKLKVEAKAAVAEQAAKQQVEALDCLTEELKEWTTLREKPTLTPQEVAKVLGIGHNKVLGWIKSGKLKATNVSNTATPRYRVARDAIKELETRAKPKEKRVRKSTGSEPTPYF